MARPPRSLFAAPLVVTAIVATPAGADDKPKKAEEKFRFDGYQCYQGPEGMESSVPCPKKLLPRPKKKDPVIQEAGGGACRTFDRKQVRCPPNLIAPDPAFTRIGDQNVGFDEATFACHSWVDISCPPEVSCNPPPPQPMACPEELLPRLAPKVKPTRKKKGKCYLGKVRVACKK